MIYKRSLGLFVRMRGVRLNLGHLPSVKRRIP